MLSVDLNRIGTVTLYVGIIDECFSRDGRNLHRFLQIPSNWAITEMILIAHLLY